MSSPGDSRGGGRGHRPAGGREIRWPLGLYRLLLRAYPADWREEYAEAMEEVFEGRWREAALRGRGARVRLWVREAAAAIWIGGRARVARRSGRGRAGDGGGRMLWREARFAGRRLLRSPGFTLATVSTLALAVAANVAIFTLVRRVVLNPLPYDSADELVHLDHGLPGLGAPRGMGLTEAMYVLYRRESRTFESIAVYRTGNRTFAATGEPERLRVATVTPSLAEVLRVGADRGRWLAPDDVRPGASSVAVISHRLWVRVFGGDPSIIGRTIRIDRVPTEVVGVMRETFAFPDDEVDVWLPDMIDEADPQPGGFNRSGVARLGPGATIEAARSELERIIPELPVAYPGETSDAIVETGHLTALPEPLKDHVMGGLDATLWVLLGAAGLVLLVACANISNLLLARSESRQRDVAVRVAIGSGRSGILGYFLAESALLSGAGGLVGCCLAWGAVRVLVTLQPVSLPRIHEIRFDGVILAFAGALILASALVFTAIPWLRRRPGLAGALRESGRGVSGGERGSRTRNLLMGTQVAFALVLLVGCGLLVRSFVAVRAIDPGFDASSALTFRIGLPESVYPQADRTRGAAAQREILDRLAAIPGVDAAAMSTCLPLDGFCYGDPIGVRGVVRAPGEIPPIVTMRRVSPGYLETMGMRMLAGRGFDAHGASAGERAAVVSRRLADLYFPGAAAIGQQVSPQFGVDVEDWYTVVGVVDDVPTGSLLESEPVPAIYFPLEDGLDTGPPLNGMAFVLRTAVPPESVTEAVRAAIRAFDDGLPIANVETLRSAIAKEGARMAFTMTLLALASGIALLLGVIGMYAVIAYLVSRRTGEIGIRLVLGARPSGISALILRQAGLPMALGMLAGLAIALVAGRLIESLLYGVDARDPITFVVVSVLLALVAFAACWIPARQAARLDPATAIRSAS